MGIVVEDEANGQTVFKAKVEDDVGGEMDNGRAYLMVKKHL